MMLARFTDAPRTARAGNLSGTQNTLFKKMIFSCSDQEIFTMEMDWGPSKQDRLYLTAMFFLYLYGGISCRGVMDLFRLLKKLVWLPLVAVPMLGCSSETLVDKGRESRGLGIVNDTLAMVAVEYWEEWNDDKGGGTVYTDWGLMLVDTRYKHIYWESKGEKRNNYMRASPLDDSTMVFWDTRNNFWFWKFGYSKSKPIKAKWTTSDSISYELIRPWKDGKFLSIERRYEGTFPYTVYYGILDTANGTISKWVPTNDEAWLNDCVDTRWDSAKEEAICLIVGDDAHNLSVLKNLVDTLHISIPQDINISGCLSLQSKLIGNEFTCRENSPWPQTIFFVDSNLQVLTRKPIYYPSLNIEFIDSLGNKIGYSH